MLAPLGGGGMGDIFLGEQVSLGRKVALKVLKQDLSLDKGMCERLEREARLLASVDHPAVVRVIDFGEADGRTVLVMELAEGTTLEQLLKDGPFSPRRAVPLLVQLAEGLAAIHQRGIVHRDIKPENVVVSDSVRGEQARLLDFGIARLEEASGDECRPTGAMVLGTPEYLSPEQAVGARVEGGSDLYSFGVLAFRMLSGVLPFPGPTARELLAQHVAAPPIPLDVAAPELEAHPGLCELVMRCLEKNPAQRPVSALALAAALLKLAPGPAEPLAHSEPRPSRAQPDGGTARPAPTKPPVNLFATMNFPLRTPPEMSRTLALYTGPQAQADGAQNLTVMLTDLVGFTERTSQQTYEENARMLANHDAVVLPIIRGHGGRVVQRRGDALLVVFRSPTGAVLCGMALQDALWRRNLRVDEKDALRIRVVLHQGEVLVTREGPLGEPIHTVALVEKRAEAGDVVMTEAVRLAMNRAEAPTERCGELVLEGMGSLALHRCLRTGSDAPYGGRDLAWVARSPLPRALAALRAFPARIGGRSALPLAAAALSFIAVVGLAVAAAHSPTRVATRALHAGDAAGALVALGDTGGARADLLRVQALHLTGRHAAELAALARLPRWLRARDADRHAAQLAADYLGAKDKAPYLAAVSEPVLAAAVERVGKAQPKWSWATLRMLDAAKAITAERAVAGYAESLASNDCTRRSIAAKRLGELGGETALTSLKKLAASRRPEGLVFSGNCGHDEAAVAIKKAARKSSTVFATAKAKK